MFQRDYILRLIEEFAKFLAAITGLKADGNLEEALKKIDEAYNELLEVNPKMIKSLREDEVLDYLQKEKEYDKQQLNMVAELLYQEGMIYVEEGDPVSAGNVLKKSKILIGYLMDNDSTFSFDWYEKLHEIDHALDGYN
mgnify:CR=1 FL=1|jgi:hypothetical protein